jgi:hypothetical protein
VNTGIAASKNAVENNFAAVVVRAGGMICVRISVCANYVAGTGLAALLGISVVNSLSENDKTNAINAIRSGDSFAIASLTEEQIDFLNKNKNKNDFLIADFADRIPLIHGQESNSSTSQNNGVDGSSDSNNIAGSGSVVAGGAPGLPPDDDDDKSDRNNVSRDPNEIKNTYNSIKDSPNYPKGFRDIQDGKTKHNINNLQVLEKLRKIEQGQWKKVYQNGYDSPGNKISIHYFQSQSGRVFNVKVKLGWSLKR